MDNKYVEQTIEISEDKLEEKLNREGFKAYAKGVLTGAVIVVLLGIFIQIIK